MADAEAPDEEAKKPISRRFFWPGGLSARLLILTLLFVLVGGALALPAALAAFQEQWLLDRVRAAETIARISDIAPDRIDVVRREELLKGAGIEGVAISTKDVGLRLVLQSQAAPRRPYLVDLRDQGPGSWLIAPFNTLLGGEGRSVRVRATPRFITADFIEVVGAAALLARGQPARGRLLLALEVRDQRLHSGAGEQRRRIRRHQRRRRHDQRTFGFKKIEILAAKGMACHEFLGERERLG